MGKRNYKENRATRGSGSFRTTPSGNYEYRFSYPGEDGKMKKKSVTGRDMVECFRKAEEFKSRVQIQNKGLNPNKTITEILKEKAETDLAMGYVKEQGYCRNLGNIRIIEKSVIGNIPIRNVTKVDVMGFFMTLSGYSKSTVKKIYAQVKIGFNTAAEDGYISDNFMIRRDMRCPDIGKEPKKVRAFSVEEQNLFVQALERNTPPKGRNDYRLQIMIELYSGMRMGEINALRREDIDLEGNILHVRRTVSRGIGYKSFIKEGTKTGAGIRDIPISSLLRPYLEEAIIRQKPNERGLLFYDFNKDDIVNTSQVNNYYTRICNTAGLPALGQHSLRHSFATRCIESGITPVVLKNWLGHTDIHITIDTYTDVFNSMNHSAVDAFDEYIRRMEEAESVESDEYIS